MHPRTVRLFQANGFINIYENDITVLALASAAHS